MLAILTAVIGFASPFLPEVFKWLNRKQENAHEKEMMSLRLQAGAQEHLWKMEEIVATADIEEARELHKPAASFGVQMLDAAANAKWKIWATAPAFYMFTLLDFVSGMVRPTITYAAFSGYLVYKFACFKLLESVSDHTLTAWEGISRVWGEQDFAVLTLVLSYYFGLRSYKATFGGSASSGKPGA